MKPGGTILLSTAVLALAACATQQGELQIRAKPSAVAQGARPVPLRIAEARGHLALGNVALALESFRKASREDPNSIDALAGMAACYDLMARYDLSRRYYESALALAPADVELLGALAASLQLQGRPGEAAKLRQEIAARSAPPVQLAAVPSPHAVESDAAAEIGPIAIAAAPAPAPAPVAIRPVQAAAASPRAAPSPPRAAPSPPRAAPHAPVPLVSVQLAPAAPAETPAVKRPAAPAAPALVASKSVTIRLPPARPVEAKPAASKPVVAERKSGPRLERLSLGEIALVTAPGPVWRPTVVAQDGRSTTVRFVPLREASASQVRLLNAARVNRLAARTRAWLVARGWRTMPIGDAPATRARSVILYPRAKRALAERLSAQFGFAMAQRAYGSQVTVLLGRDAARHPALRPERA